MAAMASAPASTAMPPGGQEPIGRQRVEHVDRAELLHGPRPPEAEPGGGGDVVGLLEGGLGRRDIAAALGAADHLERLALHRRLAGGAGAVEGRPGEGDRDVGLDAAHGGLGGQGVGPGQAGRVGRRQRAGGGGVRLGVVPPAGGQVGGAQHEVDVGPLVGIGAQRQQLAAQRGGASGLAGLRAHPQQHPVGGQPRVVAAGVAGAGGQGVGRREGAVVEGALGGLQPQGGGAVGLAGDGGQLGGEGARARPVRSGSAAARASSARAASAACSAGRAAASDGITGEGVAEPEAGALDVDQLRPHRLPQELGGLVARRRRRWRPRGSSRSAGRAGRPR